MTRCFLTSSTTANFSKYCAPCTCVYFLFHKCLLRPVEWGCRRGLNKLLEKSVHYILCHSMSNQFLLTVYQQWHSLMCNFSLGRPVVPKLGECPTYREVRGSSVTEVIALLQQSNWLAIWGRIHGKMWAICGKINSMLRTSRATVRTVDGRRRIASLRPDTVLKAAVGKDGDWRCSAI